MVRNVKDTARRFQEATEQFSASIREVRKILRKFNVEGSELGSENNLQSFKPSKSSLD